MSIHFCRVLSTTNGVFDGRAFNIPLEDVPNYFIWRHRDWIRNSLAMYCKSFFSAKQLHGKNREEQHELLFSIGKNWARDLTWREKNGTFIFPKGNVSDGLFMLEQAITYPLIESWIKISPFWGLQQ